MLALTGRSPVPFSICGWSSLILGTAVLTGKVDPLRIDQI